MTDISFEKKVRGIDWTKYLEPEYFDPEKMDYKPVKVVHALIALNRFNELNDGEGLGSMVRFAIGNDHRGTYYPAALEAIDLIIEVENQSDFEPARNCAHGILNDLHYFQLELGSDDEQLYAAIESVIKEKLRPYAD